MDIRAIFIVILPETANLSIASSVDRHPHLQVDLYTTFTANLPTSEPILHVPTISDRYQEQKKVLKVLGNSVRALTCCPMTVKLQNEMVIHR